MNTRDFCDDDDDKLDRLLLELTKGLHLAINERDQLRAERDQRDQLRARVAELEQFRMMHSEALSDQRRLWQQLLPMPIAHTAITKIEDIEGAIDAARKEGA